ncbi:hypothetical protein JCM8097_005754 [Rhodosporidiobolus ruineniae]
MFRTPPSADKLSFTAIHRLLNPKFESYKLSPPSLGDEAVQSIPLKTPFRTPALPEHARLSYNEVSARARHNHLAAGRAGEVLFVDGEGVVTAVELDSKTGTLTLHTLARLPLPTSSATSSSSIVPEYPTALPLSNSLCVISSGRGTLHLLRLNRTSSPWTASLEGVFSLSDSDGEAAEELTPFRLHAANAVSETEALVLLSKVVKNASSSASSDPADESATPSSAAAKTRLKIPSTTMFEYLSARISLAPPAASPAAEPVPLKAGWRLRGSDLPAFVEFDAAVGRYCIGTSAPLSLTDEPAPPAAAMDVDAALDAAEAEADAESLNTAEPASSASSIPKPPPFSWIQDKESLTVAFPIPSDTPTSSIRITFSRTFLTLLVASPSSAAALSSSPLTSGAGLPRISHKKLWAEIDPHTSVWTFDREAEGRNSTFGLLTLHLEKQHAGTRWPDVFASSASAGGERSGAKIEELDPELEYEHVPETLDPSELAAISEKMEQWAQGLAAGSGLGLADDGVGHGVPTSLIGDEMDVEVDAESGRNVVVNWVEDAAKEGKKPRVVTPHPTVPSALLSTALPLTSTSPSALRPLAYPDPTLSIKHDVDGLLFSPSPSLPSSSSASAEAPPSDYTWTHEATFPALAFVLATKRDTRFVYHVRSPLPTAPVTTAGAVLAFDAPAILPGPSPSGRARSGGGNLFVYVAPPAGSKATTGRQMVVRVGGPGSGALMGAVGVELEGGEVAVVTLCEREVGVLRLFA